MSRKRMSPAVIGAGIGLVVTGVLIALFGSIAYGVVLALCGVFLPVVLRPDVE